jgi:peptide deformylase
VSIVRFPHPALEQVAEAVPHGERCHELVAQMLAAMQAEGGIGLAAPQLGVLKRVIVVAVPVFDFMQRRVATVKYTLINPEIVWTGGSLVMGWEGCLSFPAPEEGHGKYRQVLVPRYPRITVRGFSLKWEPLKIGAKNLVARALQHEIDHLNGRNLATYARMAKETEDQRKLAEELPHENPVATADPVAN